MTVYCIDDGGDGSQTNTTQSTSTLDWSKADASVADLISYDAAAFTTSGNIIFFGDDHNDPNKAAHWTLTGPTSGNPVILISADRTQSTPTYKVGTGNQLSSLGGAYNLILDGSFAVYGIFFNSGAYISLLADTNEMMYCEGTKFLPAANSYLSLDSNLSTLINCIVDGTNDGSTGRTSDIIRAGTSGRQLIYGMTFSNVAYRTGYVIRVSSTAHVLMSGCDFSGFTNATTCEIVYGINNGVLILNNCKTKSSPTLLTSDAVTSIYGRAEFYNVQAADDPTHVAIRDYLGDLVSCPTGANSVYRTGGATIESVATSWKCWTTANATKDSPFYSPWIYGTISSTGDKTFTVYITNDAADFNNDEAWIEVEFMDTADSGLYTLVTDKPTTRLIAAAAQADDTGSTWNGPAGPSFTYKQSLSVSSVNVSEEGQFRARVAVAKASISESTAYFYIDPKVTVS